MEFSLPLPETHPYAPLLQRYDGSQFINTSGDVAFLYTHNPKLIQQFIDMRSELYAQDPKFVGFREFEHNTVEDYCGNNQVIQVLMLGDRCIGGGMLTFCEKGNSHPLPLEIDLNYGENGTSYSLRNMLPELELHKHAYVEASRMLVHPEFRTNIDYIGTMFANFYHHARDRGVKYFFAMTDKLRCRMYRKVANLYAGTHAHLYNNLQIPDKPFFEGVHMQMMVWDIQDTKVSIYQPK